MTLIYSILIERELDWTDEEISIGKKYLKWEELDLKWEDLNFLWEEISILIEIIEKVKKGGGGASFREYMEKNPWDVTKRE